MAITRSEGLWPGRTRFVFLIPGAILVLSVATFAMAVAYAKALLKAPLDASAIQHRRKGPSHTQIIFYATTMPFISILLSICDLTIQYLHLLQPIYVVASSSALAIGWIAQWALWMDCEVSGLALDNSSGRCPDQNLQTTDIHGNSSLAVANSVIQGRIATGFLVAALYVAAVGFAAVALHKARLAKKMACDVKMKELQVEADA